MMVKHLRQDDAATEAETTKADEAPNAEKVESTTVESPNDEGPEKLNPYAIVKQMAQLEDAYEDAGISVEVLGRTAEYNDIVLLKVSKKKVFFRGVDKFAEDTVVKKIIFIVHGLTPKGLQIYTLTPSNLVKMETFKMLLGYYFKHLDKFDIYVMPLANPDATLTRFRYWDKNMSPQISCQGVALDRNFDVKFNPFHKIHPCSQHYPGPYAFSEPETRAVREVFNKYGHKMAAYMHVHYGTPTSATLKGEAVLYPRGYSEVSLDEDKYVDLRGEIEEAIKNSSLEIASVVVDSSYNWYGAVNGTSVDYASSIYGIPFAMELVMQQYKDDPYALTNEEKVSYHALIEIWGRVINVIFNSIHKHFLTSDSRRFFSGLLN